LDIREYLSDE
jgi:hypothetical protein